MTNYLTMKTFLLCAGLLTLSLGSCQKPLYDGPEKEGSVEDPVVYGSDDRRDVYDYSANVDTVWAAAVADFSVALMRPSSIDAIDPNDVVFNAPLLSDPPRYVCHDERFASQQTAAFCSGTLIAPDLVLTAGHCVRTQADCNNTRFVFNYYMTSATTLQTVTTADIFSCDTLEVQEWNSSLDYAIIRLTQPATGRTPAPIATASAAVANNTTLIVNGSGSGLPVKIDDGGVVRDSRAATLDFFIANLDTFGGNSGSGVFDATTGILVGILVRGDVDYVFDSDAGCSRPNECPDDGCEGESSTYAFQAVADLCATSPDPNLCPWLPGMGDGNALTGDFNGDGLWDWMRWDGSPLGWMVCLSNGSNAFTNCTNWLPGMGDGNALTGDFNGDGLWDWMRWDGSPLGWMVCLSNGSNAFTNCTNWLPGMGDGNALTGDFNGDGLWDWMRWDGSPLGWMVCLSNGSNAFTSCTNWLPGMGDGNALTGDFNGDGSWDWMRWDGSPLGWMVCLSNGSNAFTNCTNWLPGMGDGNALTGDFNGDGSWDWVRSDSNPLGWMVCLSNGSNAFTNCTNWLPGMGDGNALTGDFNGDGLWDWMRWESNPLGWLVRLSNGDDLFMIE